MYIYKDKNVRKNLFDQTSGLSCQSPVFHSVGKKMMLFRDKTWAYPHSVFPVSSPEAVGLLEYIPPHIILLVSTYVNGMVGFIYLIITLTASKLSLEYCNDNFIIKMLCRTKKKKILLWILCRRLDSLSNLEIESASVDFLLQVILHYYFFKY